MGLKIAGCDLSMSGSGICTMELDDELNCVSVDWLGFAHVKKNAVDDHVVYYQREWYRSRYELTETMIDHILSKVDGCEYAAVEDYAIAACGRLTDIGEFVGQTCYAMWKKGIALKKYVPQHAKICLAGKGNADKVGMYLSYESLTDAIKPDLRGYPVPKSKDGVSPTSDIIDAYALCELLRLELAIRKGLPVDYTERTKKIFGNGNVLKTDFIRRRVSS